ncbi:MAG: signal recognition particle-docking protein FtsY [Porticoccaceae bacterium]
MAVETGLAAPAVVIEKPAPATAPAPVEEPARRGLFRRALARTGAGLGNLLLGRKAIDAELYEELETSLLMADMGVETASAVIAELTARVKRRNLGDAQALRGELRTLLLELLEPCQRPLVIDRQKPFVMLVVGVNGVGKTTTIGKLAHRLQSEGRTLMLAAGDTFRAAAVEQLQAWGERNRVPVVSQGTGADSASVIFDAIQSAQARQLDVVIADTAGRLHTKDNLMAELTKVRRVMAKLDPDAPHETLLVLDAGTGQNAVVQMRQFSAAVAVTGIALTKLDGTAKGGVIFALCREFGVPIRYVGLGEGIDDLQPFDAELFVDALLATGDNAG